MKKIFLTFFLFLFAFSYSFALESELWREAFFWLWKDQVFSKVSFSWKDFESIKKEIYTWVWWEKINIFPEILEKIDKKRALELINDEKLQIYWQIWLCGESIPFEKTDEICVYNKEKTFVPDRLFVEIFKIFSKKEEIIEFEFFPISPDYFAYYRAYSKKPPFSYYFYK